MIIKKQVHQPDKKANPFIGIILLFISIILLVLTGPLGFIYAFFYKFGIKGFRGISEYSLKIAISIDQLGNVLMQHLLNVLWIQPGGYQFGNRDETVSSALGRNKKLGTLTGFGKGIDQILNTIDPNHSLNSIDYYIEPTQQILDKLAWIHLVDRQILAIKEPGQEGYSLPSVKRELGETDFHALFRGMEKQLGIKLHANSLEFIGIFEGQARGGRPGILVRKTGYSASFEGEPIPHIKTTEIVLLTNKDRELVSDVDQSIFDFLQAKGKLK